MERLINELFGFIVQSRCCLIQNQNGEYIKRGYSVAILLFAGKQTAYPLDERIEIMIAGEPSAGNPLIRFNVFSSSPTPKI